MDDSKPASPEAAPHHLTRAKVLVWALLVAAFVIRAFTAQHARFLGDEALFWSTARGIVTFEHFPSYGPSITGTSAGTPSPINYYFFALGQLFGASPYMGGLFVAATHTVCLALIQRLLEREVSRASSLIFLAFAATSPWMVSYSDRMWSICTVCIWGGFAFWAASRPSRAFSQGVVVFLASTAPAVNMAAPALWASLAVLLSTTPRFQLRPWAIAAGLALALATYAPSIAAELRTDFANTRAITEKSAGSESKNKLAETPSRVALYALLFGSSEIGYQLEEGYFGWRPYDDARAYLEREGWQHHIERDGVRWTVLAIFSVAVSAVGWGSALWSLLKALRMRRRVLPVGAAWTLACLAGLVVATLLMVIARKQFFPHYIAYLLPALLVPPALGLDALRARLPRGLLWPACTVVVVCCVSMVASSYRNAMMVERRNGVMAIIGAVRELSASAAPFQLRFRGVDNSHTFQRVAELLYHRPLQQSPGAERVFIVHNDRVWPEGEAVPPGSSLHSGILLEVVDPPPRPRPH